MTLITVKTLQNRLRSPLKRVVSKEVLKTHLANIGIDIESLSTVLSQEDYDTAFDYVKSVEASNISQIVPFNQEVENEDFNKELFAGEIIVSGSQKISQINEVANSMQVSLPPEEVKRIAANTRDVFVDRKELILAISQQIRSYVSYMLDQDNEILRNTSQDLQDDMNNSNQLVVDTIQALQKEVNRSNGGLKSAIEIFGDIFTVPKS